MINREKVIKGLVCCIKLNGGTMRRSCESCPYNDNREEGTCISIIPLLEDALALLKEQEPRVMTLEEAINGNQVGYVEFRYHPDRGWVKCDFTCLDDEVVMMLSTTRTFYQQMCDYKQLWRLWTSRPTYEQMEATPWEMPEAKTDEHN